MAEANLQLSKTFLINDYLNIFQVLMLCIGFKKMKQNFDPYF